MTHHSPKKRIYVPNVGKTFNPKKNNLSTITEEEFKYILQRWIFDIRDLPDCAEVDYIIERKFDAFLRDKERWEVKKISKPPEDEDDDTELEC